MGRVKSSSSDEAREVMGVRHGGGDRGRGRAWRDFGAAWKGVAWINGTWKRVGNKEGRSFNF